MAKSLPADKQARRQKMMQAGSLQALLRQPDGREALRAEAKEPDGLITPEALDYLDTLREERHKLVVRRGLFFSTDDVIVVPGFMGSALWDETGPHGLIWIDPLLTFSSGQLSALKLAAFKQNAPEKDAISTVRIEARSAIPIIYDLLAADLELRRYDVRVFPVDWRKNLDESAAALANQIGNRLEQKPRPLHILAHSQGALVARRALQLLGADGSRRVVNNLVLLGPANFGTFAAAFALAGTHATIGTLQQFGIRLPADFHQVVQSFTGLYQLLPWRKSDTLPEFDPEQMKAKAFWKSGVDPARLAFGFGWAERIDTSFLNDRTTIILGNRPDTAGAVAFDAAGKLVQNGAFVAGDGTVPDRCAMLPDVRTFRAAGVEHMKIPLSLTVLAAIRAILRGDTPSVERVALAAGKKPVKDKLVAKVLDLRAPLPPQAAPAILPSASIPAPAPTVNESPPTPRRPPPAPPCRSLRVFSFDPLLATRVDSLGIAEITIDVPWEEDGQLNPGPVGEYLEVVDFDPTSNCFYHPTDLAHPRLLAQHGLPPSESSPQFHQQMVYAVAMSTISVFEKALGRAALWAPRLERDQNGEVIRTLPEKQFVPRLRIYPHALREANAYYEPDLHALLFGYFPSRDQPGGETLPGGVVFTCQSFDIIAHETTHALLHGLHRYYLNPSNADVFAFHEAFADVVALFQHFSHVEVIRHQVALTRGDLTKQNLLGQMAQQFGEALGHRGALRQYIGKKVNGVWTPTQPDPTLYRTVTESHERGAILVAALFHAFLDIYQHRVRDLYRIATGGSGIVPAGDIHPDLVNRLAVEASKSAQHILTMCVRALDYVPPVDLTFGEYLRALITADADLVHDDDRGYRTSVIDAFRRWGIYPDDVNVLDESAVRWRRPEQGRASELTGFIQRLTFTDWNLRANRRTVFLTMQENGKQFRKWLFKHAHQLSDRGASLGLLLSGTDLPSIPRNAEGRPKFEVHSIRPCSRIGPDGQQRLDLVAEVVQRRAGYLDPNVQESVDKGEKAPEPDFWFRGGCTLIIDPESGDIRYCIRKRVTDDLRLTRQRDFERTGALPSLAATYFGTRTRNPFAMLHSDE